MAVLTVVRRELTDANRELNPALSELELAQMTRRMMSELTPAEVEGIFEEWVRHGMIEPRSS